MQSYSRNLTLRNGKVVAFSSQERSVIFQKTENVKLNSDTLSIPHISVGELLKNNQTSLIPCTSCIVLLSLAKALFLPFLFNQELFIQNFFGIQLVFITTLSISLYQRRYISISKELYFFPKRFNYEVSYLS